MTDKKELIYLQIQARKAGRICTFYVDANGAITSVFYINRIIPLLTFAEIERRAQWGGEN